MSKKQTFTHPCTNYQEVRDARLLTDYIEGAVRYSHLRKKIAERGGCIVREWRESQNISLRKMAQQLGVTPSFLSKVETGKEILSPELAAKIAGY